MQEPAQEKTAEEITKSCSDNSLSVSSQKEGIAGTVELEENFSSPTPVKTKEPSRVKSKEELAELPAKYGMLLEFFDRMTSSLRLLSVRKKTPSFQNVSSQLQIMTGREFQLMHLAQIKYILPEAVQIEKILIHDEETKCMKQEMKIALLFDAVEGHHEESAYVALSSLFSSRLRAFYIKHPEGCDVPEATLPEPFKQRSITVTEDSISNDVPSVCETEILNSSHLPPSFRRHFVQNDTAAKMEKIDLLSPIKSTSVVNEETERPSPRPFSSSTDIMSEGTPVKLLAESGSLLVETPVQSTPMRSISPTRSVLTCEDENKKPVSQNCKPPASTAKKALDFYGLVTEETNTSHKQISVCLPDFVLLVNQVFQSVNFCPITKEELVQKIIMNNFDIDDHSEVETQMKYLEKLVPDWFLKKLAPSGDLLYSVKKVSDLKSICERTTSV